MTFGPKTNGVLYHYTSHKNLRCIVEDRRLRISHVYYMSDASEIKYGAESFKTVGSPNRGHVLQSNTESEEEPVLHRSVDVSTITHASHV